MDRKAWIVVSICSLLLVLNFIFNSPPPREPKPLPEVSENSEPSPSAEITSAVTTDSETPAASAPTGEKATHELATKTNRFELSTRQGGIVLNEFLEEKSVHSDSNVLMNDLAENEIGALTTLTGQALDRQFYAKSPKSTGDQISYLGKTTNGLGVVKTWSKVNAGAGPEYRLRFTLDLVNSTDAPINIGGMAIATGSAAPVFAGERENYLKFFWQQDNRYDTEASGYFSSFFGADPTEFSRFLGEGIDFVGVENQFFATIVSPQDNYNATFRVVPRQRQLPDWRSPKKKSQQIFSSFLSLPDESIQPKEKKTFTYDIFIGPKNNGLIRSLEGNKGEVMDYGWFGWISRPLNWTLNKLSNLYGGEGNSWSWGWAIVTLTLIIRTLMWPLHAKSTRTMKRMSKLQPKMKALKEKYPDDPTKMNQETMKLYREFGVNPMGGCLPMLLQIPIFFGFYNMLQYAVELRNQPFLGWVDDLSQPDTIATVFGLPINILPILMAVTMVIQMSITPKTGDKMQQRIFMLMPLVFFFFCYNFASALALYWTTQNIFSIGQTWLMQKMPEPDLKKSKNAGKKSMMQKLAERAEEAQKLRDAAKKGGARPGQKQAKPKKPRGPKTGG